MGAFRPRKDETRQFDLLPPDPVVSRSALRSGAASLDFEDAEFEVMRNDTPRRRYRVINDNIVSAKTSARIIDEPSVLSRLAGLVTRAEHGLQQFSRTTFTALAVLVFMTIFWVMGSLTIARTLPHALPALPPEPLAISKVSISVHKSNGIPLLEVSAQIRNQSDKTQVLPTMRLELVPGISPSEPMIVTPLAASLKPGESTGFTARYPYSGGKLPEARLAFDTKGAPAL